jgi:hypothetical protein
VPTARRTRNPKRNRKSEKIGTRWSLPTLAEIDEQAKALDATRSFVIRTLVRQALAAQKKPVQS